jgi:16S rRNA C1402 N4-methylase RsmH
MPIQLGVQGTVVGKLVFGWKSLEDKLVTKIFLHKSCMNECMRRFALHNQTKLRTKKMCVRCVHCDIVVDAVELINLNMAGVK